MLATLCCSSVFMRCVWQLTEVLLCCTYRCLQSILPCTKRSWVWQGAQKQSASKLVAALGPRCGNAVLHLLPCR